MNKYANNSFLTVKVSLINDLRDIYKTFGVDTYEVAEAIGLDDRTDEGFLRRWFGWGESYVLKDTNALIIAADMVGYEPSML